MKATLKMKGEFKLSEGTALRRLLVFGPYRFPSRKNPKTQHEWLRLKQQGTPG